VQPLETAIITSLDVRVGQVVKKGERLATLDPTFAEADQSQLRTRLSSLETQSQRLEAEISGKKGVSTSAANADTKLQTQLGAERQANYKAQMTKLEQNIARLRATIDTNQRDQQMLAERVKSLKEIEVMQEKLTAMQYGSRAKLLESQDKRLEVERDSSTWLGRLRVLRPELCLDEERALLTTWADDPWARMAYSAERWSSDSDDPRLMAEPVGRIHFAGEHTAGDWAGLMEGALRSGDRVAQEVLQAMGRPELQGQ
jgi:chaperonin cofactor prefoldin